MKLNRLYIFLPFLLGMLSCGDEWLDETELGSNRTTSDFTTNEDYDKLVQGAYFSYGAPGAEVAFIDMDIIHGIATSDIARLIPGANVVSGSRATNNIYFRESEQDNINWLSRGFYGGYQAIHLSSLVLDFYDNNEPFNDPGASRVPYIRGDAHFARALAYYKEAQVFAPPLSSAPDALTMPLRTEPTSAAGDNLPLATNQEIYNQIIADAEAAIDLLPSITDIIDNPDNYPPTALGRGNREAAQALLAWVYFELGNEGDNWDQSLRYIGEVLGSNTPGAVSATFPLVQSDDLQTGVFVPGGNWPDTNGEFIRARASETIYQWINNLFWRGTRVDGPLSSDLLAPGSERRGLAMSSTAREITGWNDPDEAELDQRYRDWYVRLVPNNSDDTLLVDVEDPVYGPELYAPFTDNIWTTKWQNVIMNVPLFRSPQMYLIRAAINFERGDAEAAREDLNVTRTRAGLVPLTGAATFNDVEAEWIKELGFEGLRLRFLRALKREVGPGDRPNAVPIPYDDPSLVFALPEVETIRNPTIE